MWEFFKRLFRIGKAEAHSALDQLENPIRMSEQGIRDLKLDLDKSIQSLAEVKAIAIRNRRDAEAQKQLAADYETKARMLLQKAKEGGMSIEEAKRLAAEALARKEEVVKQATVSTENMVKYDSLTSNLDGKIKQLKSTIATWENELKTLKARATVSNATAKINKELASIDSSSTMEMLNRMKEKVEQQEALAESYGELANVDKNIDDEINKALEGVKSTASLDQLMGEMGMLQAPIELEAPKQPVSVEANKDKA